MDSRQKVIREIKKVGRWAPTPILCLGANDVSHVPIGLGTRIGAGAVGLVPAKQNDPC